MYTSGLYRDISENLRLRALTTLIWWKKSWTRSFCKFTNFNRKNTFITEQTTLTTKPQKVGYICDYKQAPAYIILYKSQNASSCSYQNYMNHYNIELKYKRNASKILTESWRLLLKGFFYFHHTNSTAQFLFLGMCSDS